MPKQSSPKALILDTDAGPVSLPAPLVARLCRVDARTVARWRASRRIPATARALLELYATGRILPADDGRRYAWRALRVSRCGQRLDVDGFSLTPGELRALVFTARQRALFP